MNVGPAANGLTPHVMSWITTRYLYRKRSEYESIAIGVGVTVGIIVGIATCVFSAIAAHYYNSFGHYEEVQFRSGPRQVWRGDHDGKFILCMMSAMLSPLILGIAAGFATYGSISSWGARKVAAFTTFENEIKASSDNHAPIPGSAVCKLMEKVDDVARRELLEKMNFEQIAAAKETLGHNKLKSCLEEIQQRKEAHHVWLDLLKLPDLSSDAMVKKIKSVAFQRQAKQYPKLLSIVQQIIAPHKKFAEANTYIFQCQFFPEMPTQAELNSKETIELTSTRPPLVMNKALLYKASTVIARKERETWKDPGKYVLDDEDYDAFSLFARGLEGNPFTKEEYLLAIPTFDKYDIEWQRHMLANLSQFTEDEVEGILINLPGNDVSRAFEERRMHVRLNMTTLQELLPLAKKYGWERLRDSCIAHINTKLQRVQYHSTSIAELQQLIKLCREHLSEEKLQEVEQTFAALLHGPDLQPINFRIRYEIAKENKWQGALNQLHIYCQNRRQELLDAGIWSLGEIPDDLAPLLYI